MPGVSPPSDGGYQYYQKQLSELEDDIKSEAKRARQNQEERLDAQEKAHREQLIRKEEDAADTINDIRQKSADSHARDRDNSRSEIERLKAQTYDKHGRYAEDLEQERKQGEKGVNDVRKDFENQKQKMEIAHEAALAKQDERNDGAVERETKRLNESHTNETRNLRKELKDMAYAMGDYHKGRTEGFHDAVQEYENDWRYRLKAADIGFKEQEEKLKGQLKEQDAYFGELHNLTLREKDASYAELLRKEKLDAQTRQSELVDTFDRSSQERELHHRREKESIALANENRLRSANQASEKSLVEQAKNYQDTMARQAENTDETINQLEKELVIKNTSEDPNDISPAAEAAVRRAVVREYEKTMSAEKERTQGAIDSTQREYSDRMKDLLGDNTARNRELEQRHTQERDRDRADLLNHIQDLEFTQGSTLRSQTRDQDRERDNLSRAYAQTLDRQRRQYEEILTTTKSDASTKLQAVRQEAQFESKMAQRAFAARQNELIREYEKKLADQKVEHDVQLQDVKTDADRAVREASRLNRVALDEQARSYEQRIAQMEFQQKERERYLTENYEADTEKLRRSYALLSQKKS